ncbi:tetratricopeptide repeat protein [Actinomyces wuliandei]|uniref:tetratricopeptide repeat protein n=1 Tax=Actinomyces wuliandei TaxID=2057743 RepID=UPI00111B9600|nr:tetratricopeptide repeat protein [Actinomyces wuliandei]
MGLGKRLGKRSWGRGDRKGRVPLEEHGVATPGEEGGAAGTGGAAAAPSPSPPVPPQREAELRATIASLTDQLEALGGAGPAPAQETSALSQEPRGQDQEPTGPGQAVGTGPGKGPAGTSGTDQRVTVLNELGAACAELGDAEAAVAHYEASMALHEQFGPAYSGLLTLYNNMLRQAAALKDDGGVRHWNSKIDDLTALSKRVMRSRY